MSDDLATLNKLAIAAAKQHMGHTSWLTVAFTFSVAALFVINLILFANGAISAWLATLLMAILTYMSYTPMHEAAHSNICGNQEDKRWLNDLCGYLAAPMISIPYASHRHEHFTHHRHTNQPDKDPDFMIQGLGKGVFTAVYTVIKFIWLQNTYFANHRWDKSSFKERATYCAEIFVSLGWKIAFIAAVDQPGTAIVIIFGYFLGGYFTAYWFAYRPHLPYTEAKRYKNTSSLLMPKWMKPVEWFWLGQNLHSIHHLFPRIPFFKYHALHKEIEPILRAQGTPIVGIFDQKPR
jgi:beta-carotene hydroxylase